MSEIVRYVGLDYHSTMIQVCVLNERAEVIGNRRVANDVSAIMRCVEQGARVRVAIEACSGASNLAEELISRTGWSVDLAHPGYVNRLRQNPDKTDYSDARMLADLERVGYLPRVWLAPEPIRQLRALVRHRQVKVDQRRAIKLRIRAILREHRVRTPEHIGRAWTLSWMRWIAQTETLTDEARWCMDELLDELQAVALRIRRVEDRLRLRTAGDPIVLRLMRLPGVGMVTACILRASIGRFDRFNNGKQLARFCGLSPRNASSGQRQADAGLIQACDRRLRSTLIELAHRIMRMEGPWREMGRQMRERGKPGSLAAAAVANRWIRKLYVAMKPMGLAA